ncbi:rhodanese-like domain-containing protein [Aliiroseovarius marinus]|uniref:rhodanese-like domain-containing protein n=1 Tax=Aliiroseovarius marinus TaxID=2500159 RepID=UPI003D7D1F9B
MYRWLGGALAALVITSIPATAQDVGITSEMKSASFSIRGATKEISRNQDVDNRLSPEFTKTSRPCPPFCIAPIAADDGVATLGELEVIEFLKTKASDGSGLLIDSRVPEWFAKGTIPGAVNVPFATVDAKNPYRDEILKALGAVNTGNGWDFDGALELVLFCNGPWCEQSLRAIHSLRAAGYPAEKLGYYRGGMQVWILLGLTVEKPNT